MTTVPLPTIHPGEVLAEEFLAPLGMTTATLADRARLPVEQVERIVGEQDGITADVAQRLAEAFGTSPDFWLTLQTVYERDAGQAG